MCFGMGCGLERYDTGTCGNPRHCVLEAGTHEGERRRATMESTRYYCPECEQGGMREWLETDGHKYTCLACEATYTAADLREAYDMEASNLEADAAYIRQHMLAPLSVPATVAA